MPAWAYKRQRAPELKAPDPIHIKGGRAIQTSHQIREFMLCRACEGRFAEAEDYVSRLTYRRDNSAPLLTEVGATVFSVEDERLVEPGNVDLPLLAYFVASVVWRGHVAKNVPYCHLGKYAEAFRRYLLGETIFPEHASCKVSFLDLRISTELRPLAHTVAFPLTEREGVFHSHRFIVCGLCAYLAVGKDRPDWVRGTCIVRGEVKLIILNKTETAGPWLAPMFRAKAVGALAKLKPPR